MILLWGVVLGILAGYLRARIGGCPYQPPVIRGLWVVVLAFVPQFLAFFLPATRMRMTYQSASIALVISLLLLLFFVWMNIRIRAFWLMGAGLLMNLAVIATNGGLMPVSPDTIDRLHESIQEHHDEEWETGSRWGVTKDIVLAPEETNLVWLSDRFTTPGWYPQRVAFSLGDILVAVGTFGLLWMAGNCRQPQTV